MAWFRFLLIGIILMGLLMVGLRPSAAVAQSAATISLRPPDLSHFPQLSIEFKALDGNRQPLTGLQPEQLTLTENGVDRPLDDLTERYRGVHFALVVNGNREMDLRDGAGVSRYEKLSAVLRNWAVDTAFRSEDVWSLVTHDGILIRDTNDGQDWLSV
ncbi:MAG: hypothetical protein SVR81_10735, partial [Chloroflexota bacterium]|nr:hypothetical protein [Chloroflexota bacterium]